MDQLSTFPACQSNRRPLSWCFHTHPCHLVSPPMTITVTLLNSRLTCCVVLKRNTTALLFVQSTAHMYDWPHTVWQLLMKGIESNRLSAGLWNSCCVFCLLKNRIQAQTIENCLTKLYIVKIWHIWAPTERKQSDVNIWGINRITTLCLSTEHKY